MLSGSQSQGHRIPAPAAVADGTPNTINARMANLLDMTKMARGITDEITRQLGLPGPSESAEEDIPPQGTAGYVLALTSETLRLRATLDAIRIHLG